MSGHEVVASVTKTVMLALDDGPTGERPILVLWSIVDNAIQILTNMLGVDRPPAISSFIQQRNVNYHLNATGLARASPFRVNLRALPERKF